MTTPRVEINLEKIAQNVQILKNHYATKGITIIGVTKAVCGDPGIAKILVEGGIKILADSRIANIKKMKCAGVNAQFILLRTPLLSELNDVVAYANISHNTELSIIAGLSKIAVQQNLIHKIILMVELGDLREGILPANLPELISKVKTLKGVEVVGIGANLACFGGIMPDEHNMAFLSDLAVKLEQEFDLHLTYISGGNSANYNWFLAAKDVGRINYLRIGESIFLGVEPLFGKQIPGLFTDAFLLAAEIIESNSKLSIPYGKVAQNAFGDIPSFEDRGKSNRVIAGIGRQDVDVSGLSPRMAIEIVGASSDHLIMTNKKKNLKVGTILKFDVNYAALLSAMTSPYVLKRNCIQ